MSVETVTLGCRLNFAETETIARTAPANEDWIVVNSCAVSNEAVRQTRQAIRRAHRQRPDARILVTGCAAELDPRSFEAIRDAVAREIDRGAKEIVLTGVDITDYEGGLGSICQRLLAAEPRLKRLRLSSLDSIEIDAALFELIAGEPRLMPHFHLSLQAGDDLILKRMKRRHSRADAVRTVERIKIVRPDASIGADLISGFPTETEDMAVKSLQLLDDCDIIAAHVFPFSPRPNTPAA